MTGQYLPILYIIGQYLPRTTPKARIMSRVEEEKAAKMRPNTNNRFPRKATNLNKRSHSNSKIDPVIPSSVIFQQNPLKTNVELRLPHVRCSMRTTFIIETNSFVIYFHSLSKTSNKTISMVWRNQDILVRTLMCILSSGSEPNPSFDDNFYVTTNKCSIFKKVMYLPRQADCNIWVGPTST